jgi:glycerol-3-phosphate dehydrogenase
VSEALWARLRGRYGARAPEVVACAWPGELESVGGTATVWAELRWALRHEQVHHLDDLLLRRVRVGLFLPRGAEAELPRVHDLCAQELGWGAHRWAEEAAAYRALWARHHAPFAPTLALPVPAHAA